MWKKRWIVVPVTLVALALGVTGGVAMAQESEGDSPLQSFASRVASILGIDEQQVEDALEQASREMPGRGRTAEAEQPGRERTDHPGAGRRIPGVVPSEAIDRRSEVRRTRAWRLRPSSRTPWRRPEV